MAKKKNKKKPVQQVTNVFITIGRQQSDRERADDLMRQMFPSLYRR